MLPLISNVLPTTTSLPSQNSTANASLLISASGDASAISRQFMPSAVIATGAPAAYFPGTAPRPQPQLQPSDRTIRVQVPPPTGDYIEIQQPPAPPVAAARFSVPVTLGIPLTTQLTAQVMAQQVTMTGAAMEDPFQPREEKLSPPSRSKEPSFGAAKGTTAYGIAAARSAAIQAKPEIEAA